MKNSHMQADADQTAETSCLLVRQIISKGTVYYCKTSRYC